MRSYEDNMSRAACQAEEYILGPEVLPETLSSDFSQQSEPPYLSVRSSQTQCSEHPTYISFVADSVVFQIYNFCLEKIRACSWL